MGDVIIAIVPAPGHEGLVTEGPMGERPALLYGVIGGGWFPPCRLNEHRIPDGRRALVLYAPGGPRLGMVRAMEAAGVGPNVRAYRCYDGPARGQWWERPEYYSDRRRETRADWSIPEHPFMGDSDPVIGDYSHAGAPAYAVAHLLHQIGKGSEVLVLPVPS